jgi:hypothetical protein
LSASSSSPKSCSPDINTKLTQISSSKDDENDLDNDNENISVTGSPDITSDGDLRDETLMQTSTTTKNEGAFTSIIQKSNRKSEFTSNFPVNSVNFTGGASTNPVFNHALAAHLFFQNPLLPQPNQWLYNHLYNNYNDFPWLRHSLTSSNNSSTELLNSEKLIETQLSSPAATSGLSFLKRSITLLTNDKDNDSDVQSSSSPPVSSTKRSPSPELIVESNGGSKRKRSSSVESITNENVNEINRQTENFINRTRTLAGVKQNDVWRPY